MEKPGKVDPKLSLEIARRDLARAEAEVDTALSALQAGPRAEKTGVTRAVEDAFEKVRAARRALDGLELERE
jgi:hypothetical protein